MRRDTAQFDPATIRRNAERFAPEAFQRRLLRTVEELCGAAGERRKLR
jgi:hypothetical protein